MRHVVIITAATTLATLAACAPAVTSGKRAIDGRAERGSSAILAVDSSGKTVKATPDKDGRFHLKVNPSLDQQIFVVRGAGAKQTLMFAPRAGAPRLASQIPAAEESVHLGALSTCDCNSDGAEDEATPENNPLGQVDSDGDGESDYDDADDDNDATADDDDDDRDGDGETDCDSDDGGDSGGEDDASDDANDAGDDADHADDADDTTDDDAEDGAADADADDADGADDADDADDTDDADTCDDTCDEGDDADDADDAGDDEGDDDGGDD